MNMDELLEVLPKPVGYKVLIALPPEKSTVGEKNLIIAPEELRRREQTASIIGNVLAMGPDAYKDQTKFPSGAWCQTGDWVLFKSYSGIRFKVKGQEFRLLNDDSIDGVAPDPRLVERAF